MTEKIIDLVYDEINAERVMTKLKMSNIDANPKDSSRKNPEAALILYNRAYETMVSHLEQLTKDHSGKELRIELNKWSRTLHKDAMHNLWGRMSYMSKSQESYAMLHFSRSIIAAFKKLPRKK